MCVCIRVLLNSPGTPTLSVISLPVSLCFSLSETDPQRFFFFTHLETFSTCRDVSPSQYG